MSNFDHKSLFSQPTVYAHTQTDRMDNGSDIPEHDFEFYKEEPSKSTAQSSHSPVDELKNENKAQANTNIVKKDTQRNRHYRIEYEKLKKKYEKMKQVNRKYEAQIHKMHHKYRKSKKIENERRRSSVFNYGCLAKEASQLREDNESLQFELHSLKSQKLSTSQTPEMAIEQRNGSSSHVLDIDRLRQSMVALQGEFHQNDAEMMKLRLMESEELRKSLEIKVLSLMDHLKDKKSIKDVKELIPSNIVMVGKQHKYDQEIAVLKEQIVTLGDEKRDTLNAIQLRKSQILSTSRSRSQRSSRSNTTPASSVKGNVSKNMNTGTCDSWSHQML